MEQTEITKAIETLRNNNSIIEKQYRKGIITYEEFINKQKDIVETAKSDIFQIVWMNQ